MPLGIYVSVPFCRTKCSYCNFSSDVFARTMFARYVDRVTADIENSRGTASAVGGEFQDDVDSIYLGGGTPTLLESHDLKRLFVTIQQNFRLQPDAEITLECAPGTLSEPVLASLIECGVNRVSLGVQSFVDQEAGAVARLHKRATVINDIARLRAAGLTNLNIDLIAGLPHQTAQSWEASLKETVDLGVPHASVYMLEIDQDSRLGRELMAGGTRYHAHFVPDEDLTADLYLRACEYLEQAGVKQYEISNFARPGFESTHNLKYWTRRPYLGFGVDAHSMLQAAADAYELLGNGKEPILASTGGSRPCEVSSCDLDAVRFANADSLDNYIAGAPIQRTAISRRAALEETFFLGLRLTQGVNLKKVAAEFGPDAASGFDHEINAMAEHGLLWRERDNIRLTERGRLLSNEVFERFLSAEPASVFP